MNELPCNSCGVYFPFESLGILIHGESQQVSLLCAECTPKIKELLSAKIPEESTDRS